MYHRCLCCKVDWSSSLFIPRRVASFGLFAFSLLVVWEERVLVRPCDKTELTRGRRGHQRERGLKIILFPVIVHNREIKHDVYGQRQTGNGRLLLVVKA